MTFFIQEVMNLNNPEEDENIAASVLQWREAEFTLHDRVLVKELSTNKFEVTIASYIYPNLSLRDLLELA